MGIEQAGQSTPAPRQWREGDLEPKDRPHVVDRLGRVWTATPAADDDVWAGPNGLFARWPTLLMCFAPIKEAPVPPSSVSPSGENTTPAWKDTGEAASDAQSSDQPLPGVPSSVAEAIEFVLVRFIEGAQSRDAVRSILTEAFASSPLPAAQVEIDDEADTWYVRVLDEDVHHTTESAPVNLDWTRDGRLIGIELLGPLRHSSLLLPDSETEPESWEAGAYIEPGIGGVANVSTSGWPGGVERVWLRVSDYARGNHGADIVLEPDEADEIAGVLRGAARSVRRDRGEVTS